MLEPVHHIEYVFERGKGWLPVVVREASIRQAVKTANFGIATVTWDTAATTWATVANRVWLFEPDDLP